MIVPPHASLTQAILELVGLAVAACCCIAVVASIFTGRLDDVDTRGPRRQHPK